MLNFPSYDIFFLIFWREKKSWSDKAFFWILFVEISWTILEKFDFGHFLKLCSVKNFFLALKRFFEGTLERFA